MHTAPRDGPPIRRVGAVRAALHTIGSTLSVGFILFFFSETLFWGRPDRAPLPELLITWLAYAVLAGALLSALAHFHTHTLPTLVLCGALYGWLVEGVLAGTLYDAFPLQLSWTGLAWHDLLSVCAGWYALSMALGQSVRRTLLVAAGLGVFWGAWAVMWWQPAEGGVVTPLASFAAHAFLHGVMLALAFAVTPRVLLPTSFRARWGHRLLIVALSLWFAVVIAPQRPLALLIAPPLFTLTISTLRRRRARTLMSTDGLTRLRQPLPWVRYAPLLALPTCAVLIYALALWSGALAPTNYLVFGVLTPLGFVTYLVSIWAVWRPERSSRQRRSA